MTAASWKKCVLLVAVLAVAAGSGCRKRHESSSSSSDGNIFTTDTFPGGTVQEGNVADDQRAFSTSGENTVLLKCVLNGNRGTAIAVYETTQIALTPPKHLFAHFFDGSVWTPPVPLTAPDVDSDYDAAPESVAFINTTDHASAAARERDGDAIILWAARDIDDDGAGTADGDNRCLFSTYFDVTHAYEPSRRFGFQEQADRLSVGEMFNEEAALAMFVTDGLCGEQRIANPYRFGDPTSGIVAAWLQLEDNDLTNANIEDVAVWYCSWDLAAGGDPDLPLVPRPSVRLPVLAFGASDAASSSEETIVGYDLVAYNNVLLYRVGTRAAAGSGTAGNNYKAMGTDVTYGIPMSQNGDDVTLQYVAFDLLTGTPSSAHLIGTAPDSTDAVESNSDFIRTNGQPDQPTASVYGSDEGLAELIVFYHQLSYDADAVTDFGSGAIDGALCVQGINEATGALYDFVALSNDDPSIYDSVTRTSVATQISRNGDYLWVAFRQPDASGASDDLALRVVQITTPRPAADGTVLITPLVFASSLPATLNADIDSYDVRWLQFQDGLGYICGVQSDPDVMNLCFQHSDAGSDEVFIARLTANLSTPPSPTITVTGFETFGEGQMAAFPINDARINFNSIDSGDGGNVFAVFRQEVGSTTTDFRLFARRSGAGTANYEIDSAVADRQLAGVLFPLRLIATPPGAAIGTYDPVTMEDSPDRSHPAGIVHVMFFEDRYFHGAGTAVALRARTYDGSKTGLALGDAILPSVGTDFQPPFDIDLPNVDPGIMDYPAIAGIAVDGTTVGLWFTELGHVYYQEYNENAAAWLTEEGVSNPILVDDDSAIETDNPLVFTPTCTCNNLHGTMVFWGKLLDAPSGNIRLQVRVRE